MKLKFTTLCSRPMTTLATMVRLNEVMPPMTAATSARDRVCGPRVVRSPAAPLWPAIRMTERVDSAAARAHTNVETNLGLMLDKRASRGLLAQALTVRPSVVRSRNHVKAMRVIGTMIRIERSDPRTVTPATVHVPLIALGKWMVMAVGVGILMAMARASCETPMVATRTTTRGDLRNRRMMARSTTAPKASPKSRATARPTQKGT